MNQMTSCTEAVGTPEQKHTQYLYNHLGQLQSIVKPSGIALNHTYTMEGLLAHFWSSDGSVSYSYQYNINKDLIASHDEVSNQTTHRRYDNNDNLIEEQLGTGHSLHYAYDRSGRVSAMTLPDNSKTYFTYNGPTLIAVTRHPADGQELYRHVYDEFDLSENPLRQTLLGQAGELRTTFDRKGRFRTAHSKHVQEIVPEDGYDRVDNLRKKKLNDEEYRYAYDSLYQLVSESGSFVHAYTNDSLYNRLSKDETVFTINNLNQLQGDFQYDRDGNLIRSSNAQYIYDALDRLTCITENGITTTYTYDSFNRRLTKTTNGTTYAFIYDDQNEIGCMRENRLVEFRALGTGIGAEIGAAVAIELKGKPYAPIHDLSGNVIALIDSKGNLFESYRYSAFGEEQILDAHGQLQKSSLNPWRFSSKRTDEELHLIYFGRRYYDPSLGRWLTQDPLGYADGPNLYAYVSNNPLTHHDLYGLAVAGSHSHDRDSPRKGRLSEPTQERSRETSGSTWSQVSEFAGGLVGSVWDPIEAGLEIYDNKPRSTARKIGQATGLILSVVPVVRIGSFALRALNYSVKGIQLCKNIRMLNNAKSAVNATRTSEKITSVARAAEIVQKNGQVHDVLTFSFTKTASKHLTDLVSKGPYAGKLARPFMRSPLTIKEIMKSKGMSDPAVKGALNFKVPGKFRNSQGNWELVIDPDKNLIYHFNFKSE